MKLHDNSRFGGGLVILEAYVNLLKTHRLIEITRRLIGFANFEVEIAGSEGQKGLDQGSADALAAKFRGHHQIENLQSPHRHLAGREKSGQAVVEDGHAEILLQIVGGVPVRGLSAGSLDGGDFRQVRWSTGPNNWHIGYYALAGSHPLLPGATVLGSQATGEMDRPGDRIAAARQSLGAERGAGVADPGVPGDGGAHRGRGRRGPAARPESAIRARSGLSGLLKGESREAPGAGDSLRIGGGVEARRRAQDGAGHGDDCRAED